MDELLKNKTFAVHAAAALGSVALGTAVTYPLDTLKVLIQVGSSAKKQLTVADVLKRVRALSGYSGLYNGVGWMTLGRASGLGVRFGVYEILTAFYKGDPIAYDENLQADLEADVPLGDIVGRIRSRKRRRMAQESDTQAETSQQPPAQQPPPTELEIYIPTTDVEGTSEAGPSQARVYEPGLDAALDYLFANM